MKFKNLTSIIPVILLIINPDYANAQTNDAFANQNPLLDFDYNKPTFKLEGEQLSNRSKFLRFSVITGYREGVKPIISDFGIKIGIYNNSKTGTSRIAMYNLSLQDLLSGGSKLDGRIILQVKDVSKYRYDPKYGNEKEWLRKNAYCYELALPAGTFPLSDIFSFIREDVAYQFNLKVVKEIRMSNAENRYGLDPREPNREVEVYLVSEIN